MEELHSLWKVPSVAHFCFIFREAFDLFHFEIEEFEAALLGINETPYCATIEQLAMRLLQGCCNKTITCENWEEKLKELFNKKLPQARNNSNYVKDTTQLFNELSVEEKVQILFQLCELRLDAEDTLYALNNLDSDRLRIEPVVTDSEKNVYYYFFGTRLYKEDTKIKDVPKKTAQKKGVPVKSSSRNTSCRTSSRNRNKTEEPISPTAQQSWSVVCRTQEDWESIIQKFKKSKNDKNVGKELEEKYLTTVTEEINRLKQLERKRFCDFGPRRISERIKNRKPIHRNQSSDEWSDDDEEGEKVDPKKLEEEEKAKRAAEKILSVKERAERVKLRELQKQRSAFDEEYPHFGASNIRTISPIPEPKSNKQKLKLQNMELEKRSVRKIENKRKFETEQISQVKIRRNETEQQMSQMKIRRYETDQQMSQVKIKSISGKSDLPPEKQKCDISVNKYRMIQPKLKPIVPFQNVVTYTPCVYPKVNNPLVVLERIPSSVRTYSKLDPQWLNKNDTNINKPAELPLSQAIQYNFVTKLTTPTIIRPVPFHRQFYN